MLNLTKIQMAPFANNEQENTFRVLAILDEPLGIENLNSLPNALKYFE